MSLTYIIQLLKTVFEDARLIQIHVCNRMYSWVWPNNQITKAEVVRAERLLWDTPKLKVLSSGSGIAGWKMYSEFK